MTLIKQKWNVVKRWRNRKLAARYNLPAEDPPIVVPPYKAPKCKSSSSVNETVSSAGSSNQKVNTEESGITLPGGDQYLLPTVEPDPVIEIEEDGLRYCTLCTFSMQEAPIAQDILCGQDQTVKNMPDKLLSQEKEIGGGNHRGMDGVPSCEEKEAKTGETNVKPEAENLTETKKESVTIKTGKSIKPDAENATKTKKESWAKKDKQTLGTKAHSGKDGPLKSSGVVETAAKTKKRKVSKDHKGAKETKQDLKPFARKGKQLAGVKGSSTEAAEGTIKRIEDGSIRADQVAKKTQVGSRKKPSQNEKGAKGEVKTEPLKKGSRSMDSSATGKGMNVKMSEIEETDVINEVDAVKKNKKSQNLVLEEKTENKHSDYKGTDANVKCRDESGSSSNVMDSKDEWRPEGLCDRFLTFFMSDKEELHSSTVEETIIEKKRSQAELRVDKLTTPPRMSQRSSSRFESFGNELVRGMHSGIAIIGRPLADATDGCSCASFSGYTQAESWYDSDLSLTDSDDSVLNRLEELSDKWSEDLSALRKKSSEARKARKSVNL